MAEAERQTLGDRNRSGLQQTNGTQRSNPLIGSRDQDYPLMPSFVTLTSGLHARASHDITRRGNAWDGNQMGVAVEELVATVRELLHEQD